MRCLKKAEAERLAKEAYEEELHKQQMLALELEKQKEQEKLDEEIALKEVLKEQMGELRSREMEVRKKSTVTP